MDIYKRKYLKYKIKYLQTQLKGGTIQEEQINVQTATHDIIALLNEFEDKFKALALDEGILKNFSESMEKLKKLKDSGVIAPAAYVDFWKKVKDGLTAMLDEFSKGNDNNKKIIEQLEGLVVEINKFNLETVDLYDLSNKEFKKNLKDLNIKL